MRWVLLVLCLGAFPAYAQVAPLSLEEAWRKCQNRGYGRLPDTAFRSDAEQWHKAL